MGQGQQLTDSPVAAGQHALNIALPQRLGQYFDLLILVQGFLYIGQPFFDGLLVGHGHPLKGRARLGNKGIDAQGNLSLIADGSHMSLHAPGHRHDAFDVLVCFHRKANHDVHADVADAGSRRQIDGMEQVLFRNPFIDDVAHVGAARFRRQGNRLLAAFGQPLNDGRRNRIGPQGGAGKRQPLAADKFDELVDIGIVRYGRAHEADFLAQALAPQHGFLHVFQRPHAGPPVTVAGHAEPAVPAAAAGDFNEVHRSEFRMGRRHDRFSRPGKLPPLPPYRRRRAVFRDDGPQTAVLVVFMTIQGRHVYAGHLRQPAFPGLAARRVGV